MEIITGKIESVSRSFNGWRFAKVAEHGTVVGCIPDNIQPGDTCTFTGKWSHHPKYGRQFKLEQVAVEVPKESNGLQEYLVRSFMWVGPVLAENLVNTFGDSLFDVIEKKPEQLTQIKGITAERAAQICEEYVRIKEDREKDVWFATHHITLNMRNRLIAKYGNKEEVIAKIRSNPYLLADQVWGIGFKKADQIALSIGILRDSAVRVGAAVRWILKEATNEGHCFLPKYELIQLCLDFIGSNNHGLVHEAIADGVNSGKIVVIGEDHEGQVYQRLLYNAEIAIAEKLRLLVETPHAEIISDLSPLEIEQLDADQYRALELALKSKIIVITGGPGTGKTYTVNLIIRALGNRTIELAAPTGKAAKRMSEMSGRTTRTIHRLLEYSPIIDAFQVNKDNPLECDTLIIDETSMIDVPLMKSLMDAVTPKTQIIFVGDVDQLPSVGAGRVLADMIESGAIPVARLNTLHRQAGASLINRNAKRINAGEKLELTSERNDFWFVPEEDATRIPEQIVQIIGAIPENFYLEDLGDGAILKFWGEDELPKGETIQRLTMEDIQVLCPQKRGPVGTDNLNEVLRPILNSDGRSLSGVPFQVGDRVIQTRNNYGLWVFNGDIGRVCDVDDEYLYVEFDDLEGAKTVPYPKIDIGDLKLAYALTIHKSQGSEFPVVVIPVHTTNFIMLKRNLLYTGVTRGKKLVILVGTMKAVNIAIKTLDSSERNSNLKRWLKEAPMN